jgi:uracil-DNA glycosylase
LTLLYFCVPASIVLQWCRQGVLLLNASLTVRAKTSNSHAGKGWEGLTSAALQALAQQRSGIVFLLWGK